MYIIWCDKVLTGNFLKLLFIFNKNGLKLK